MISVPGLRLFPFLLFSSRNDRVRCRPVFLHFISLAYNVEVERVASDWMYGEGVVSPSPPLARCMYTLFGDDLVSTLGVECQCHEQRMLPTSASRQLSE